MLYTNMAAEITVTSRENDLYVPEELDAWLVELAFRRIDVEAGLVKSAERLVECGVVFVLVSVINHDVVTNISYSGNIGYQRLEGIFENLCRGVDSKTDSLILVQFHVRGEGGDVSA